MLSTTLTGLSTSSSTQRRTIQTESTLSKILPPKHHRTRTHSLKGMILICFKLQSLQVKRLVARVSLRLLQHLERPALELRQEHLANLPLLERNRILLVLSASQHSVPQLSVRHHILVRMEPSVSLLHWDRKPIHLVHHQVARVLRGGSHRLPTVEMLLDNPLSQLLRPLLVPHHRQRRPLLSVHLHSQRQEIPSVEHLLHHLEHLRLL
jgi:hypothetical protein